MAIDLPSSSQISLRGSQNALATTLGQRQDALQAALSALNIKDGEAARALVKSVSSVDDSLRARLVSLANPVTDSAAATTARPAGNATPAALTDNLAVLLKSQSLKLVEINIKGRGLLTFTDQPLKAGVEINVQANRGRLLILPQPPAATSTSTPAVTGHTPGGAQPTAINNQQLNALQQQLRLLLPRQEAGSAVSETLHSASLVSRLLTLPVNAELRSQLPRDVQTSLQLLASHLRTPQQLGQPGILKLAMNNSGLQLEQRLAKLTGGSANPAPTLAAATAGQQPSPLQALARHDMKAALLLLATQLVTQLPAAPPTPTAEQQSATALYALLRQLLYKPDSGKSLNSLVTKDQLLQQLQQQVNQALDKVFLQQLQSLQRGPGSAETGPTQHWQLEIPLRYGHEVQTMHLRIDEDWVNDYAENSGSAPQKLRQWLVKLAFELPAAGTLHAHLVVVDSSVSASLWAEQPGTLAATRLRLPELQSRLEKDGVTVKKIECFAGKPVADQNRLNYSLVDVKT